MTATKAIHQFFKDTIPPVTTPELKEFKESCTMEEWEEFGNQAKEAMGITE